MPGIACADVNPDPELALNQFTFTLPESKTIRQTCEPPDSASDFWTVVHDCHPPVGFTAIVPLTFAPLTSRWKLPPLPVATRNATV